MQRMIMYAKEEAGNELQASIVRQFPRVEISRTIKTLSERLRQTINSKDVVVLIAATGVELDNFLMLRDLLNDFKLILILPDRGPETIVKGHVLRPRLLCCLDDDVNEIMAVLAKMQTVAVCKCTASCADFRMTTKENERRTT
jgi:hypothetical protein